MSGKGHSPRPYDPTAFSEGYDRIFRKPVCPRCGGAVKPGIALQQTYVGHPDFPGDTGRELGCTISAGGPGRLTDAMKCEQCGHSHLPL